MAPPTALGDSLAAGVSALSNALSSNAIPDDIQVLPGRIEPLGPSPGGPNGETGVNFALAAPNATSVTLCLYNAAGKAAGEGSMHRDGSGVWHGFVPGLPLKDVLYGVRVDGQGGWETPFRWDASRVLLDPYARYVVGRGRFGVRDDFEKFEPVVSTPDDLRFTCAINPELLYVPSRHPPSSA